MKAISRQRTSRFCASLERGEVAALEQHLAADDPRVARHHADDGARQRGLAAAGLADEPDDLPVGDLERAAIDRRDGPAAGGVFDLEVLEREDRQRLNP